MSNKVILVRSRDPSWLDEKGQLFVPDDMDQWKPVVFLDDPNICGHSETICDQCMASWDADYDVKTEPQQ